MLKWVKPKPKTRNGSSSNAIDIKANFKVSSSKNCKCKVKNKYMKVITYGLEESFLSTSDVAKAVKRKQTGWRGGNCGWLTI